MIIQTGTESELISRQQAIDAVTEDEYREFWDCIDSNVAADIIRRLPSAHPETCEGCKHLGKWENEIEYGYPSPCTRCKRKVEDHYER